eukprot:754810-Hanusia_phi.AAC.2
MSTLVSLMDISANLGTTLLSLPYKKLKLHVFRATVVSQLSRAVGTLLSQVRVLPLTRSSAQGKTELGPLETSWRVGGPCFKDLD